MSSPFPRIVAVTPFEFPQPEVAAAASAAGALGVLGVGRDAAAAGIALAHLASLPPGTLGVRLPRGATLAREALPASVGVVVVADASDAARFPGLRVMVEAVSLAEARAAVAQGAHAIIAKGGESGGRVGDESAFVLLQSLVRAIDVPIYVQGGIGMHTAAACIAGGASGVVLDAQLALARESTLPVAVKDMLAAMDGSETAIVHGHRVLQRPGLTDVLPAGQDAALAAPLAARYRTVGGIVRGIDAAIDHHLAAARSQQSLAPGSPFAHKLGARYPIVQGPMTRVSDRAAFAAAVADGGGVPFVALALMRGDEVKAVLADVAQRLAGRPWGVGILGFVPAELRDEQLEAVRAARPPLALIAGGRPLLARPLDDLGIATFLHTPSPGLTELFVAQGTRRFVFEGSECGGHVGPRSSFVLWEQQIEALLAHAPAVAELDVVFAGGIHDGRSAAMVAAMAAPLVERGATVGVLMGTAYLFTEEAVAAGAITPTFQQAALACERTALLETAPGHATRVAETPYVEAFRAERQQMRDAGMPARDMWERLERLNLGRLRLAAKGLRRDGDELVAVDTATQLAQGMVMLGEVAALRDAVTTIGELHREVADGARARLAALPAAHVPARGGVPLDIAIVGMATIFPGAPDLARFWSNIVAGVDSIREVPPERWDPERFYDPASSDGEFTPSKWGGFIDPVPFDPLRYGIPPLSLAAIESSQLLALEVARLALDDAGYAARPFDRERTAVIFGTDGFGDLARAYSFRALWRQYAGDVPPALGRVLPSLTEDSFPGILANVMAGRIANRLDLGGSNFTVDAACASSLAAVDVACKDLVSGSSDMVICGGADFHNGIADFLAFASVHALSPTGRCRTFSADADGIALGEGAAAIVLKRLADAQRDGDRVYAVIKGIGSGSDGKSLGLTAPRPEGQARALRRAYAQADVALADIGLIEAHGTGTVVGDRAELATLAEVFATDAAQSIALGSVKSQIGHTKCAAGLAGLVKSALAIHERVLPPTLHVRTPNPAWTEASVFALADTPRPWPDETRYAGISAFGFGGTNFHAVLASPPLAAPEPALLAWPAELFLLRGDDADEAKQRAGKIATLATRSDLSLASLARAAGDGSARVQFAFVARDHAALAQMLDAVRSGNAIAGLFAAASTAGAAPVVAMLFPGQGSQRIGMLRDLFIAFPRLLPLLQHAKPWLAKLYPPSTWDAATRAAREAALTDTRVAQPLLGLAGLALHDLLAHAGVAAAMTGGHSYGELVALCAAGVIAPHELLPLSAARGERIVAAAGAAGEPGTMVAVAAAAERTRELIAGIAGVVIANENAPAQTVISGTAAGIDAALARLRDAKVAASPLAVACAFHSPLVAPAAAAFAGDIERLRLAPPRMPVYANATAAAYPDEPARIAAQLADHIAQPVRFAAQVEAMYAAGARVFVEAGPGRVLTQLVGKTLAGRPHAAIACDRPGENGIEAWLTALAELAALGVPVDLGAVFAARAVAQLDLAHPPPMSASAWWVNGQRAWPMTGDPPRHAMLPVPAPVVRTVDAAAPAPAAAREEIVLQYLRGMREMVDAQRRVMLDYLGTSDARPPLTIDVSREIAAPAAEPAPTAVTVTTTDVEIDIEAALLAVVAERTGYPADMLGLDLDLEADLSIDSIKRVEILGKVAARLKLSAAGDAAVELPDELVAAKTLREIAARLRRVVAPAPATLAALAAPPAGAIGRFVVQAQAAEPIAAPWQLAGREVAIVGAAPPLAGILVERLAAAGTRGIVLAGDADEVPASACALVDCTPLRTDWSVADVPLLFARLRDTLAKGPRRTLVAGMQEAAGEPKQNNRINGHLVPFAAGVGGMIRSLRKESTDRAVRLVRFSSDFNTPALAARLLDEINAVDETRDVAYSSQGARLVANIVARERAGTAAPAIALDEHSVVLVTGGARGITAAITRELAARYRCRLELVGRTPAPSAKEDADLAAAADARALRGALLARGTFATTAEIEAACARILAQREIQQTLDAVAAAGTACRYHALDVRDADALRALVEDIYAQHGRLDGVIHGAGVIEDKLARHKTADSFARVFETKVRGALAIAEHVRADIGFVVFFSSIAATHGSRGQADYAAANDFLDDLARKLDATLPGRMLSINWGPWADTGMVNETLAHEYARRGIGLIAPEAGVKSFFAELLENAARDPQVILMNGAADRLS